MERTVIAGTIGIFFNKTVKYSFITRAKTNNMTHGNVMVSSIVIKISGCEHVLYKSITIDLRHSHLNESLLYFLV